MCIHWVQDPTWSYIHIYNLIKESENHSFEIKNQNCDGGKKKEKIDVTEILNEN